MRFCKRRERPSATRLTSASENLEGIRRAESLSSGSECSPSVHVWYWTDERPRRRVRDDQSRRYWATDESRTWAYAMSIPFVAAADELRWLTHVYS